MIHNIEKSTFVEADEATTKALTYDLIKGLYEKIDELKAEHFSHKSMCNNRFGSLESLKKKDFTISSFFGLLGGFIAMIVYYIKLWFDKP